jgi:hypothetical protein
MSTVTKEYLAQYPDATDIEEVNTDFADWSLSERMRIHAEWWLVDISKFDSQLRAWDTTYYEVMKLFNDASRHLREVADELNISFMSFELTNEDRATMCLLEAEYQQDEEGEQS